MREFIGTNYNIDSCAEACKEYRYYGLQNGGECRCDDDWIHSIKYGKADNCRDDGLGAGWRNSIYKTVSPLDIIVTACNGWDYGSITNSMQIQLSGINGASEYIYVNQDSQLPVNGGSSSFQNSISNIGELYHVKIMVDDEYGFCLSSLKISYDNKENR